MQTESIVDVLLLIILLPEHVIMGIVEVFRKDIDPFQPYQFRSFGFRYLIVILFFRSSSKRLYFSTAVFGSL